jgi:hypothetical protein
MSREVVAHWSFLSSCIQFPPYKCNIEDMTYVKLDLESGVACLPCKMKALKGKGTVIAKVRGHQDMKSFCKGEDRRIQ